MGSERDFEGWLERELERELGAIGATPPPRPWFARARRRTRRLALASGGAGGAIGLKVATGVAAVAFAAAATGTAVTGTANPAAWSQALEEAALRLPDRVDATPSPAAPPAAPAAAVVATASSLGADVQSQQQRPAGGPGSRSSGRHAPAAHVLSPGHVRDRDGAHPAPTPSTRADDGGDASN